MANEPVPVGPNPWKERLLTTSLSIGGSVIAAAIIAVLFWFFSLNGRFNEIDKNFTVQAAVQAEALKRIEKTHDERLKELDHQIERLQDRLIHETSLRLFKGRLSSVTEKNIVVEVVEDGKMTKQTFDLTGATKFLIGGKEASMKELATKLGVNVSFTTDTKNGILTIEATSDREREPEFQPLPFPPPKKD